MTPHRHQPTWVLIAAIAVTVVLLLMLVPHGDAGHADVWLAVLPILFIGVISSPGLLHALEIDPDRTGNAPELLPSFQRPPPFLSV
jgi:hypothetical protein